MNIGVFGAGAWGTALAYTCARSGNNVMHWGFAGLFDGLADLEKPENVTRTDNMADLKDCEYWLIVTPAAFFRETVKKMRDVYNGQPILICTKGMEGESGQFMSEILNEEIPECTDFGVLSGPQFAREVATGIPTGSTIAGNERVRAGGHTALSALYLQDSTDIIGAQICGVGKNAESLISGYLTIKSGGENERALIFTRAWDEIVDIAVEMGANCGTFHGLCGVGDLFLSATSPTSRNFSAGEAIARGEEYTGTVEGIFALRGLIHRAEKLGIPTPVLIEMKEKMGL
jgi:glycerol-3-phosphate dehydrogenase (NAD(P)+)